MPVASDSTPSLGDFTVRSRLRTGAVVLVAAGLVALVGAYVGLFVVSEPITGMRFGAVEPSPPGATPTTAAEFHGAVREDVETDSLRWYGTTLRLEYRSLAASDEGFALEVAYIFDSYNDYIRAGGDPKRVEVVGDGIGDYQNSVYIRTEWTEAALSGEMSNEEYFRLVIATRSR